MVLKWHYLVLMVLTVHNCITQHWSLKKNNAWFSNWSSSIRCYPSTSRAQEVGFINWDIYEICVISPRLLYLIKCAIDIFIHSTFLQHLFSSLRFISTSVYKWSSTYHWYNRHICIKMKILEKYLFLYQTGYILNKRMLTY